MRLEGKVAIVTGGASGLGLSAVRLFLREGARVVVADYDEKQADKEIKPLIDRKKPVIFVKTDVSREADWENVVRLALERFGKIDVLINNAGIHCPQDVLNARVEDWQRVLSVNALGQMLGIKHCAPEMIKAGGGSIVNTSSIGAEIGGFGDGFSVAYSMSKGAVRSLTKHASQTLGQYGVRVNTVMPGVMFTEMTVKLGFHSREELGKVYQGTACLPPYAGEADDIGYLYLYLASDESKYATGAEFTVDGGWVASSGSASDGRTYGE